VHGINRREQRLPVGLEGAQQQRAVDVEEEQQRPG
jgi:hypothetical protein